MAMHKHDFHIHAEYSYDSNIKSQSLVQKAISLEYKQIAFTEHLDLLPQELGFFGLKSLHSYRQHILSLQNEFPQIKIWHGVEIGDYHLVKPFADSLIDMFPCDLILGSVHFLADHTNVAIPLPSPLNPTQIVDYYIQNLCLVQSCPIDILAHLGVYKRYYRNPPIEKEAHSIICDIFSVMVERKIALEINLSAIRKPYQTFVPEYEYLLLYAKQGGRLISIGSDAHDLSHFGLYWDQIQDIIKDFDFVILTPSSKIT